MNHSNPVYVIDFRDSKNCDRIKSAKPGDENDVLVRLERPADSPVVRAKGKRNRNGFEVTVPTEHGPDTHSWAWQILCEAVRVHRGTQG